jgi:hypothetical protein
MTTHEPAFSRHPLLESIGRAFSSNYCRQEILSSGLWNAWRGRSRIARGLSVSIVPSAFAEVSRLGTLSVIVAIAAPRMHLPADE